MNEQGVKHPCFDLRFVFLTIALGKGRALQPTRNAGWRLEVHLRRHAQPENIVVAPRPMSGSLQRLSLPSLIRCETGEDF